MVKSSHLTKLAFQEVEDDKVQGQACWMACALEKRGRMVLSSRERSCHLKQDDWWRPEGSKRMSKRYP